MTEIRIVASQIELLPKDPIDVIAGAASGAGRSRSFDPQSKTGFESAWELTN